MANKDIRMLVEAIFDYLQWIKLREEHRGTSMRFIPTLTDFLIYAIRTDIIWKNMFSFDTFKQFRKCTSLKNTFQVISGLSQYLHGNGKIPQPLQMPKYQIKLPEIYENYLLYREQNQRAYSRHAKRIRRVLVSFYDYQKKHCITLSSLKIEHLDAFLAEFNKGLSPATCKIYRSDLRGFLEHLYYQQKILKRNLATLVKGAPLFSQAKPPKFLRSQEIQKLFANLKLSTPGNIRTYAMVHLAYTLGLRPAEISSITLDDISFQKAELILRDRKGNNPITFPIPEATIKAVAAYVLNVRPKSELRHLFLTRHRPHRPVKPGTVIHCIWTAMKQAGLSSSAYWLRHTYAQNLLQAGASIYEIKEMLGHENIQSAQRYLHIHTELMRKVLFNETL